jgi:hypothetical protein
VEETLDQISPILPVDFFAVTCDLHEGKMLKKKHILPDFSELLYEDSFAKVFFGWDRGGLSFEIQVEKPFEECYFPEYRKGNSIELFIDTRDLKSAGFLTRFCHHFVILPKPVDGILAQEVTAFRTDDRHELCDPDKIQIKTALERRNCKLEIFLPSECLHGYDPSSFDRLGFTYRINKVEKNPQHFALSSDYLAIENVPSRWASMQMREE